MTVSSGSGVKVSDADNNSQHRRTNHVPINRSKRSGVGARWIRNGDSLTTPKLGANFWMPPVPGAALGGAARLGPPDPEAAFGDAGGLGPPDLELVPGLSGATGTKFQDSSEPALGKLAELPEVGVLMGHTRGRLRLGESAVVLTLQSVPQQA